MILVDPLITALQKIQGDDALTAEKL